MKTKNKIVALSFALILGFASQTLASSSKVTTEIKNLDDLVTISQDLEETAPVYISVNNKDETKSCFCVCRDNMWSCTQVECEKQNKECPEE